MLLGREALEAREDRLLAPYAERSAKSRGREYPEEESRFRTAFQKDRDRVLHTTAFRRLEYKTQVFVALQGDYYRTRLTHTLEVAQVAQSIARPLGLNEDLTETIALSHDLGHPPFGHAGERILDELMRDFGGFDHNQQSYRIVTHLEQRYPGFRGLNLTWEAREGIMKHETAYDVPSEGLNPGLRPSLEAQIVNLADEIAYSVHDLDDALRSGLLLPAQLSEVPLLLELARELGIDLPRLGEPERRILIRELLGLFITAATQATHEALERGSIASVEDVRRAPQPLAQLPASLLGEFRSLRAFLYASFYQHYEVLRQVAKAQQVLEQLFSTYTRHPELLPPQVRQAAELEGRERAVCDYLAGMTDRFAVEEYARLFNPAL